MTVVTRDAVILAAVVLGVIAARRARDKLSADVIVLTVWLVLAASVLVFERAMFANHVAAFVLPLVLLVAVRPPPLRWLAIGLVVLVPWDIANQRDILWPSHPTGVDAQVEAALRRLPVGAEAIADDPGLVWRAGRATPAQMNDTTDMRVFQGSITTATVAVAAASPRNCAVVITPGGFGVQLAGLAPAIAAEGYFLAHAYRDGTHARDLWLRTPCTARRGAARAGVRQGRCANICSCPARQRSSTPTSTRSTRRSNSATTPLSAANRSWWAAVSCSPRATRPRPTASTRRWAVAPRDGCVPTSLSSVRACTPTRKRARRCSRCSRTPRRSWRPCRSTKRSSTSADCGACRARPSNRGANSGAGTRPRRPAHHRRGCAHEVPREGRECGRETRWSAARAART